MNRQGRRFTEAEVNQIAKLLRETDLAMNTIALRVGCAATAVQVLNRKLNIRQKPMASKKIYKGY